MAVSVTGAVSRTTSTVVTGLHRSRDIVDGLIRRGMWFSWEPLPEDTYEITVKFEVGAYLAELVART